MVDSVEGRAHIEHGQYCYMPLIHSQKHISQNACKRDSVELYFLKPDCCAGRREFSSRYIISCIETYFSTIFDKKDRLDTVISFDLPSIHHVKKFQLPYENEELNLLLDIHWITVLITMFTALKILKFDSINRFVINELMYRYERRLLCQVFSSITSCIPTRFTRIAL